MGKVMRQVFCEKLSDVFHGRWDADVKSKESGMNEWRLEAKR
jgi:hypothetical protein